jgi:SAM-dependent methyltransferase
VAGATSGGAYTFGDGDIQAQRLSVLDDVFGPASRRLLGEVVIEQPALAYDLGCGTGHTTRMIAAETGARNTVGLERSEDHVSRAVAQTCGNIDFVAWDVTKLPFPVGPADLIYCRLLLAHLSDPVAVAQSWTTQLNDGGLLVVDEIEWIATEHSVLQAHLHLVTSLVATTGAQMCAGPALVGLNDLPGLRCRSMQVVDLPVPTAVAATMFAMSLDSWGEQAVAAGLCDRAELTELAAAMSELRTSHETGQITWGLHQAAYERPHRPRLGET